MLNCSVATHLPAKFSVDAKLLKHYTVYVGMGERFNFCPIFDVNAYHFSHNLKL